MHAHVGNKGGHGRTLEQHSTSHLHPRTEEQHANERPLHDGRNATTACMSVSLIQIDVMFRNSN